VASRRFAIADLGVGFGLRPPYYQAVLDDPGAADWVELLAENHLVDGGPSRDVVDGLVGRAPLVPHSVGLNLAGEPDPEHEDRLVALIDRVDAPWFSDHLCLTAARVHTHELVPVPYVPEVAAHVAARIRRLQARTGRVFALENVSSYLTYRASREPEADFVRRVVELADCALLLDVNNVFVSACNHGFDPIAYLDALPLERVVQVHLAGHQILHDHRLDTHDAPVCDEVWALYAEVLRRIGPVSTLIEWDDHLPDLATLLAEVARARAIRAEVCT
jgi:uncharacterized protein